MFRGEKRKNAGGVEVNAPFDARGILLLTYRYKESDSPPRQARRNDDTWVYVPTLRRVRRISTAQRTDADLRHRLHARRSVLVQRRFVPQYTWKLSRRAGHHRAGQHQGARATRTTKRPELRSLRPLVRSDRWELRQAVEDRVRDPRNAEHPYSQQGRSTSTSRRLETALLVRLRPEGRAVEDHLSQPSSGARTREEDYKPWEGVPESRDDVGVADIVINVQTGTGNRIEGWTANGAPVGNPGKIRRLIDVGRLTKGRYNHQQASPFSRSPPRCSRPRSPAPRSRSSWRPAADASTSAATPRSRCAASRTASTPTTGT